LEARLGGRLGRRECPAPRPPAVPGRPRAARLQGPPPGCSSGTLLKTMTNAMPTSRSRRPRAQTHSPAGELQEVATGQDDCRSEDGYLSPRWSSGEQVAGNALGGAPHGARFSVGCPVVDTVDEAACADLR
jgi:hypothetical protein